MPAAEPESSDGNGEVAEAEAEAKSASGEVGWFFLGGGRGGNWTHSANGQTASTFWDY